MKKGEIYEGVVTHVSFPNKGCILYEEPSVEGGAETQWTKVWVKNVLPGQTVRFRLAKKRKGKSEGKLIEVLKPSPMEEGQARCPHYGICGGCTYQTMPYENQLILKERQVKELLDAVCSDYEFDGIFGSPQPWQYRNKMEFSFGDEVKDGPLALGMHKRDSFYDIVTTQQCQIVHPDYNLILKEVLAFCTERKLPYYHKMRHTGYLRHLLVRRAVKTGQITIHIVTASEREEEHTVGALEGLQERLLALPVAGTIVGITHIYNDTLGDVVKSDRTEVLYGTELFCEELLGLTFQISTFSFFQTNTLGAEVLYSKVREFVGDTEGKVVFDLYSGTGTITQILAQVAKRAVGVEIVEEAVVAARENAKRNGLSNCTFIAGDVLKVLDDLQEEKPDMIVLDPPREGIHPKALQKIIDFNVESMVYISCKPTSLKRDLEILKEHGYGLERACCVDMFPNNPNVETIALISKI
jgi:23S rRNA (uracil-5-)-methyltransferase RumA